MIKCITCNSKKVILKLDESKYMITNECHNCYNIINLFIDDYIKNYPQYYSFNKDINNETDLFLCHKHNKQYENFCFNCNINLCNECILSHNRTIHLVKEIKNIISKEEKELIELYKKDIINLKEQINMYIQRIKTNEKECQNVLNSLLNIIKIEEMFLYLNIDDEKTNTYDIISLKNFLNKYNRAKISKLINNIKSNSYSEEEKINIINNYKNCTFYSINGIPKDKIIHNKYSGWINHVIQLKNGNIMTAHWDNLLVYKIDKTNNKLEIIQKININNGSINHIYEYKKNKILICDNKMKIIQLSEDNKCYKCLNILDYGRKIIPFIPDIKTYSGNKKFIFMCTPNGIKLYSYPQDDIGNANDINDIGDENQIGEVKNELKFLGVFSQECDYSAIIQINNMICGIYKIKNESNNHFAVWDINYDFNEETKFDINKFNLLGEIKNVNCAIGRYSLSKINQNYAIIGTMKNGYHSFYPHQKSGLSIISLDPIEIVQYINTDEITSIECLKKGIILTGGKDLFINQYYIKEWKFDNEKKELLFVGQKNMHNDFINTISEVNDGFFMSCGRDGNLYLVYNYN